MFDLLLLHWELKGMKYKLVGDWETGHKIIDEREFHCL